MKARLIAAVSDAFPRSAANAVTSAAARAYLSSEQDKRCGETGFVIPANYGDAAKTVQEWLQNNPN